MQPFARREMISDIRDAQENALEDDWRVGAVKDYLATKKAGDITCVLDVWKAITRDEDFSSKPQRADSIEIAKIINSVHGWKKVGLKNVPGCGRQKAYEFDGMYSIENDDDLPY